MALSVELFSPDEPYADVHELMLALLDARIADEIGDTVLMGEHPPTITCGRKTNPAHILNPQHVPVVPIARGGDVTYHGPGQLVVYPIVKLDGQKRDLHAYLRHLEDVIIQVLAAVGIEGFRHALPEKNTTGVWVKDASGDVRKIASIGVGVKRWVTYHGLALNLSTDLTAFQAIAPCGFGAETMTSVAQCLPDGEIDSLMDTIAECFKAKI